MPKLAQILGYQLDMAGQAALRSLHRHLTDCSINPPSLTALIHVRERPGCDQTSLGRALAGNRSLGMKVASTLEARGLLTRGAGRDRRSKGLYISPEGERVLARELLRHQRAEAALATYLGPREREMLLLLLAKVQRAVGEEEAAISGRASVAAAARPRSEESSEVVPLDFG